MTAKAETPSKLSPSERLARKRAAARMRQQRCRARKRAAMLEQRRQRNEPRVQNQATHDSTPRAMQSLSHSRPPSHPNSQLSNSSGWRKVAAPSQPIYKCVSFESQRSFEEAQGSPLGTPVGSPQGPPAVTPSGTPQGSPQRSQPCIVTISSSTPKEIKVPAEKSDANLVPEEEAAVAAMLSLKTGPKSPTQKASERDQPPQVAETATRPPQASRFRYYREWEPRYHYEAYRHRRVPEYFKMPIPHPPPPPPHYRYSYAPIPRYARYEYE